MKSINDERLSELLQAVASIEQERSEAAARVAELEAAARQAAEGDLNAEALALNRGRKPPKAKEPEVRSQLEGAARRLAVLDRRLELANADAARYKSEHASRLLEQVQAAKIDLARRVAELAAPLSEALESYQQPDLDARELRPYLEVPAPENSGEPTSTTAVWGPMSTADLIGAGENVGGMTIGQLTAAVAELTGLPARLGDEATIVGDADDEDVGGVAGAA
jgi:hypothetical protein